MSAPPLVLSLSSSLTTSTPTVSSVSASVKCPTHSTYPSPHHSTHRVTPPVRLSTLTHTPISTLLKSVLRAHINMLRLSVLSALAVATAARASVISTSVFPNSACAGASTSLGGLVGIGKVTLSNGEVESHCGCPSVSTAGYTFPDPQFPEFCFFAGQLALVPGLPLGRCR